MRTTHERSIRKRLTTCLEGIERKGEVDRAPGQRPALISDELVVSRKCGLKKVGLMSERVEVSCLFEDLGGKFDWSFAAWIGVLAWDNPS